MIGVLKTFWAYIMVALAASCLIFGGLAYHYRSAWRVSLGDIAAANAEIALEKANGNVCRSALEDQNDAIEVLRIDYEKRIASIRPTTITGFKDRLVIKYVDRNITQGECHETAAAVDAVRRRYP